MRGLACLACLASAACGYVRTDIRSHAFYEVESAHVSLISDLDRATAIARSAELETIWTLLLDNFHALAPDRQVPEMHFHVVHLASCADFDTVRPAAGVAAMTTSTPDFGEATIVVACEGVRRRNTVLAHEMAHALARAYFRDLPAWLDEGLAEYLSTVEVVDGKVVLGRPLKAYDRSSVAPPRLRELMGWSRGKFYDESQLAYFGAWTLVHVLDNARPDWHRRFRAFLGELAAGGGHAQAWQQSFAGVSLDDLSETYAYYHATWPHPPQIAPFTPSAAESPRVRRLSTGEAYGVWIELLLIHFERNRGADVTPVLEQIDVAEKDDPAWTAGTYWRAVVGAFFRRQLHGRIDSLGLLRAYVAAHPDDPHAWRGIVSLSLPPGQQNIDPRRVPLAGLEPMEADVAALARTGSTAGDMNLVAWYWALRNQPELGMDYARRSLALEPGFGPTLDTLALLAFETGDLEGALAAEERAVQWYAERRPSADILGRLRVYRELVAGR